MREAYTKDSTFITQPSLIDKVTNLSTDEPMYDSNAHMTVSPLESSALCLPLDTLIKPQHEFGWDIQTIVRHLVSAQANKWNWGYCGTLVKLEGRLSCQWTL